ncbi:MAG: prepilin peptidase [Planctomycetota bacterium]|jgi:leader peptidase (prepilin peptidase)/N-methyltransferase
MLSAIQPPATPRTVRLPIVLCCLTLIAASILPTPAGGQEQRFESVTVAAAEELTDQPRQSTSRTANLRSAEDDELTEAQKYHLRIMESVTFLWFLTLGSVVGSFLNVVIYRLPQGRRLRGNSHCPHCNERIQWRDNLPIVGWLRLLGRCRSCRVRIPVRYPAVEALVGALFVVLLAVELLSGGKNLPVRPPNQYAGVVWIIWYTKWDLLGIYLFHCCLGCVLIAAALMQWDGHPLPGRLKWFALGTGLVAPVFWLHLHPVSFHEPRLDWLTRDWRWRVSFDDPITGWPQYFGVGLDGLLDSVAGLAAGLVAGWLVARSLGAGAFPVSGSRSDDGSPDVQSPDEHRLHTRSFCALFGISATFLGWQSVAPLAISVSTIAVALSVVAGVTGNARWRRQTTCASIAVAVLIQILLWRTLATLDWCPDHAGWPIIAQSGWWPASLVEPYGSLVLATAAGCAIARIHALTASFGSVDEKCADRETLENDVSVSIASD